MESIITTTIGIVLGATLASISFLYKRRIDHLTTSNEMLFSLLELYKFLKAESNADIDLRTEWYLQVVGEVFPDEPMPDKRAIGDFIKSAASEARESIIEKMDAGFLATYKATVEKLSKIDPVIAADLNSNQHLRKLISEVDSYNKKVKEMFNGKIPDEERPKFELACQHMESGIYEDLMEELRSDIIWLSFRCGVISYFRILYRFKLRSTSSIEKETKAEYRRHLLALKKIAASSNA